MTHPGSVERGFTLIEVLVALALMALIATMLIASLELGGHSWQRVTRLATNSMEIATSQNFLRARLEAIYPARNPLSGNTDLTFVATDGRTLEFTAESSAFASNGMVRYQIINRDSTRPSLEVRWQEAMDSPDTVSTRAWTIEPLIHRIAAFSVDFWEPATTNGPGRWVSKWNISATPPPLIRIDVRFPPGDARRWPPLYIEPRVNASSDCEFDFVSRRCRSRT